MKFAVCVLFKIKPEAWDKFMLLMIDNASTSLANEVGCLQFDICTDREQPYEVFLYELYTSNEAFSLHLDSDHFRKFDQEVSEMIQEKQVRTYQTVT